MVGTSSKSVWKLFLLGGKLVGVCWLEISIRFLGSLPASGDCCATAARIDAGDPRFVSSPSGKVERRSRQPSGAGALFFQHTDTHTDLIYSSLEPMQVHWMKSEIRNNCAARPGTRKICVCAASGEVFCLHTPSRA